MPHVDSPTIPDAGQQSTLGIREAVVYFAVIILVGAVGTVGAYSWSTPWQVWSPGYPWARDIIRLTVASMLSMFGLWALGSIARESANGLPRLTQNETRAAIACALFLAVLIPTVLVPDFVRGLADRNVAVPRTEVFRSIYLPYVPYYLYMLAVWLGTAFPLLLFLFRRVQPDLAEYRIRVRALHSANPSVVRSLKDIEALALSFEEVVAFLKRLAERYIPVVLVIALSLLYEQLTPSRESVTGAALEIGKVALWVLLGPATVVGILMVLLGYENNLRRYERLLEECIRAASKREDAAQQGILHRARELRESLTWDRSPGSFLLAVVKSGTIAIPLLFGLSIYVVDTLASTGQWLYIFVPRPLCEAARVIYGVAKPCP